MGAESRLERVVCLHQQQGGLFGPTVGEVEHLAAAALCQQVVDGEAAGLAIGDELDGDVYKRQVMLCVAYVASRGKRTMAGTLKNKIIA